LLPEFYVTLLNYIGLYAMVAVGLVLLTGVGGLTSLSARRPSSVSAPIRPHG
jgi:ABC-type branched-subunit amino acid transport system permease subunit